MKLTIKQAPQQIELTRDGQVVERLRVEVGGKLTRNLENFAKVPKPISVSIKGTSFDTEAGLTKNDVVETTMSTFSDVSIDFLIKGFCKKIEDNPTALEELRKLVEPEQRPNP